MNLDDTLLDATVVSQHRTSQGLVRYLRGPGGLAVVVVPARTALEAPMHPLVTHLTVQAKLADREREAAAARLVAQAPRRARVHARLRVAVGYGLVELGLHLAVRPPARQARP